MPEIGQSLREARMRARIDVSELEAETKIRAKYLRALENEEWDLLPGPTYVKSFLRTYAEALGLDGRLLVEEYKLRHERLSDVELQPISPRSARDRDRRRRQAPGAGRDIAVAAVVLGIVGGLIALGQLGNNDGSGSPAPTTSTAPRPAPTTARTPKPRRKPKPRAVTLTLVATGPVYVCLRARDKILVPAQTLPAGKKVGPFKARRFAMTFGNSNLRMRVNGKLRTVPPSSSAIGYVLDRRGRRPLPAGKQPTCGA
ncbi:MAG TPA: helix-turn-helix domain-containing protein [Solirubrobacteraceae bacterium]|jgi:cytoskeletal protein RodZ